MQKCSLTVLLDCMAFWLCCNMPLPVSDYQCLLGDSCHHHTWTNSCNSCFQTCCQQTGCKCCLYLELGLMASVDVSDTCLRRAQPNLVTAWWQRCLMTSSAYKMMQLLFVPETWLDDTPAGLTEGEPAPKGESCPSVLVYAGTFCLLHHPLPPRSAGSISISSPEHTPKGESCPSLLVCVSMLCLLHHPLPPSSTGNITISNSWAYNMCKHPMGSYAPQF